MDAASGSDAMPMQCTRWGFSLPPMPPAGLGPSSVAVADVDRDGKLDLVVTNRLDNTVSVLTSNGDGTFHAKVDHATGVG